MATRASHALCGEISKGGCVDSSNHALVLLLIALGLEDVTKDACWQVDAAQSLRDFSGIMLKIKTNSETKTVLSCLGVGF